MTTGAADPIRLTVSGGSETNSAGDGARALLISLWAEWS